MSRTGALLARLFITLVVLVVGLGLAYLALLFWAYATMGGPHTAGQNALLALELAALTTLAAWLLWRTWRRPPGP